ncbi:hypothetical protein CBM2586_B10416 [Cupriavidus phytorum]|uniref:Uncharacterized protein n=1 Tax=Cupriavidus taiwanensis TaxID=164546 RepID=A0A975XEN6_9BURK|nr:hypothetical protein CBM2586_B10416 [Cupriavidus taiwanensis]
MVLHRFADDAAMQRGRALAGAEDPGGSVAGTIGGVPKALSDERAAGAAAEWQDGAGEPLRDYGLTQHQRVSKTCWRTPSPASGRGLGRGPEHPRSANASCLPQAGPLPRPSPASGRGEQTLSLRTPR